MVRGTSIIGFKIFYLVPMILWEIGFLNQTHFLIKEAINAASGDGLNPNPPFMTPDHMIGPYECRAKVLFVCT